MRSRREVNKFQPPHRNMVRGRPGGSGLVCELSGAHTKCLGHPSQSVVLHIAPTLWHCGQSLCVQDPAFEAALCPLTAGSI